MRRIQIRPRARRDLMDMIENLLETLGHSKAEQFRSNASKTFQDLARMPKIGTPRETGRESTRDLRMWRIRGFEEYLVFYSVETGLVHIDRVIHAKRDFKRHAP